MFHELAWEVDRRVGNAGDGPICVRHHQYVEVRHAMALTLVGGEYLGAAGQLVADTAAAKFCTLLPAWIHASIRTLCASAQLQMRSTVPGWTGPSRA